jgi:hypothetical protein
MLVETHSPSEPLPWLLSRRADFWLVSGGASIGLLAAALVILWHGDWELSWLDFVLAEFHLGATYDAIIRRRLWRYRRVDILLAPLVVLALTYALTMSGRLVLLTSITMYAAVWHRGRQSLGVARFYQHGAGGPVSRAHNILLRGAIYLPMLAGMLAYTHLAPTEYEGEPYLALTLGRQITWLVAAAAVVWVMAYLGWTLWRNLSERVISAAQNMRDRVHPGEWWVVFGHAVAFGSGYVLGASNGAFLIALGVYHEVQYLSFTYAMARCPGSFYAASKTGTEPAMKKLDSQASLRAEIQHAASFLVWPVIGFTGAVAGGWAELEWLAPLGVGGLLCHYWFDSRIWTRRGTGRSGSTESDKC